MKNVLAMNYIVYANNKIATINMPSSALSFYTVSN